MTAPIAWRSRVEQSLMAQKSLGGEVEFLRVDDASHEIVPPNRAHAELIGLNAAHGWFRQYLKLP